MMLGGEGETREDRSYAIEPALVPSLLTDVDRRRLWSRAIDPQGVVVAMAPLQAEGDSARAALAVGAGFDLAGSYVEVTAKPTLAPASAALRGLRRAHEHAMSPSAPSA